MRAPKTCSWRDPDNPIRGCGKTAIVSSNGDDFRCEAHQRQSWAGMSDRRRRVPPVPESAKQVVRERDWHVCRRCGAPAHEVDHIIEVADGGDNQLSNLQLLCAVHHAEKTRTSQEAWKNDDTRRGTSARAKAKRRRRAQGFYVQ